MKSIHVVIDHGSVSHLGVWPSKYNHQYIVLSTHRDSGYTTRISLDLRQAVELNRALCEAVSHQLLQEHNARTYNTQT